MPYFACGSSTSTISAPSLRKFSIPAWTESRTSASSPSPNNALRHADPLAADIVFKPGRVIRNGYVRRRRIELVTPGDHAQDVRRIFDRLPENADIVERGGKRDQPVARYAPIGGFQADDPAERCRLAHRAARLRPERRSDHPGSHRYRRTARAAARDP